MAFHSQPSLVGLPSSTAHAAGETSFYDFTVQYKGQPFALSAFKDKARVQHRPTNNVVCGAL